MNEKVFEKIYKNLAAPFVFFGGVMTLLNDKQQGAEIGAGIGEGMLIAKVFLTAFFALLYAWLYFLVKENYDGANKEKFLRWALLLSVLSIVIFLSEIFLWGW